MQRQQLEKFIDKVRVAEQSNQKEVKLNINEARNLSVALTKLLITYAAALEGHVKALESNHNDSVESQQVEMDGGTF